MAVMTFPLSDDAREKLSGHGEVSGGIIAILTHFCAFEFNLAEADTHRLLEEHDHLEVVETMVGMLTGFVFSLAEAVEVSPGDLVRLMGARAALVDIGLDPDAMEGLSDG